jgi:formylglycine-generating enzyme required for sulfatase activity
MEFVLVPRGKFWMGGGGGQVGNREVEIPYDFYLGKYEVTQEQWQAVTGTNPSHFSRTGGGKDAVKDIADEELKRFPVEMVSWEDAQHFLTELNRGEQGSGWVYRLPREAEWEYACRGGPSSNPFQYAFDFYLANPTNQLLPEQANFNHGKGLKRTCKVGSYPPNRLGLYDMHGNVWEWCDDAEKGGDGALRRLYRGGCLDSDPASSRAGFRPPLSWSRRCNDLGVRLARVPVGTDK